MAQLPPMIWAPSPSAVMLAARPSRSVRTPAGVSTTSAAPGSPVVSRPRSMASRSAAIWITVDGDRQSVDVERQQPGVGGRVGGLGEQRADQVGVAARLAGDGDPGVVEAPPRVGEPGFHGRAARGRDAAADQADRLAGDVRVECAELPSGHRRGVYLSDTGRTLAGPSATSLRRAGRCGIDASRR